jgi:hypothetical protein
VCKCANSHGSKTKCHFQSVRNALVENLPHTLKQPTCPTAAAVCTLARFESPLGEGRGKKRETEG